MEKHNMSKEETEKMHTKKLIAPIIIGVVLGVYYMLLVLLCLIIPIPVFAKILMAVIPLALAGVIIFVMIERINEIRSGEEDDLSQY